MKALRRFLSDGARDADARLAAALTAPPLDPADSYLHTSAIVRAVDRMTVSLQRSWQSSATGQTLAHAANAFAGEPRRDRWSAVGLIVLTAVAVHVFLMIVNAPRPGWFWIVIPALAALFGALVLAAARDRRSSR